MNAGAGRDIAGRLAVFGDGAQADAGAVDRRVSGNGRDPVLADGGRKAVMGAFLLQLAGFNLAVGKLGASTIAA